MFKPCPRCGFLVALIAGREASQRCPRCGSGLVDENELPMEQPVADPGPRPLRVQAPIALEPPPAAAALPADAPPAHEPPPATSSAVAAATEPAVIAEAPTPAFARRHERPRRRPSAVAIAAIALLTALLGFQLLMSQRAHLAASARWRPLVETLCSGLGCRLPAWREPRAFAMTARSVRPHPARAGVLQVAATMRNDAPWPQPLPVVVLSLSDVDGRTVGARAVRPADYAASTAGTVAPGDSVDIAFAVRELPQGVSFDFQLR